MFRGERDSTLPVHGDDSLGDSETVVFFLQGEGNQMRAVSLKRVFRYVPMDASGRWAEIDICITRRPLVHVLGGRVVCQVRPAHE